MSVAPVEVDPEAGEETRSAPLTDPVWVTVVWNDPVNLMSYVTYVFMTYFGYSKGKAERLMREVHDLGKAIVSSGGREQMEKDVAAMHGYGLWATVQRQDG
ncbi:ATP-dependent Clp protease adapter ClpS [Catenulispora subtropica]|uniref:ATP-dependent Clp protease adapter protein ClpS n=1 Tax=Catenulispora subtropica TaxID=450798 RepID=A0ABP5BVY4_9ACTN